MESTVEHFAESIENSATENSSSYSAASVNLFLTKIGAMIVLGIGSLCVGALPLCVNRCRLKRGGSNTVEGLLTSLLLCFGGGVLLFTTFLHLAPEVRQSVDKLQESGQLTKLGGNLNLAELLFCGGFFLVYLVEEAVHALLDRKPEATEAALHRSVSLRRCNRGERWSGERRQGSGRISEKGHQHCSNDAKISPITNDDQNPRKNFDPDSEQLFTTRNSRIHERPENYEKNGNRLDSAKSIKGSSSCPCGDNPREQNICNLSPGAINQLVNTPASRNSFGNTTPLSQNDNNYLSQNLQIVRTLDNIIDPKLSPLCNLPLGHCNQSSASSASTSSRGSSSPNAGTPPNASLKGLLTVIALSFHAVFEGLAVGLEPSVSSVIYLAAAIATHKLVIAFCVGMEMVAAGANARIVLGYLAVFSAVTPLGIGIGLALGHFEDGNDGLGPVPALLQGIAAGTLLYVVFFEVLARERANEKSGLLQLAAILLGFMLMMGLQLASSHSHSHGHGHGHSHGHEDSHVHSHEIIDNHDDHEDHLHHHHHDHHNHDGISTTIATITEKVVDAISTTLASTTKVMKRST